MPVPVPANSPVPVGSSRSCSTESIHQNAVRVLEDAGFGAIETHATALTEDAAHRANSRCALSRNPLAHPRDRTRSRCRATELRSIGCFCIGTNQVDTDAARGSWHPGVQCTILEYPQRRRARACRSRSCFSGISRARTPTLIAGAGSSPLRDPTRCVASIWASSVTATSARQVGLLAEALGMRVFFHDVVSKLALGNATPVRSLNGLLEIADVVTLHVPEAAGDGEDDRIRARWRRMRRGAALINASRGSVVDIDALVDALASGASARRSPRRLSRASRKRATKSSCRRCADSKT